MYESFLFEEICNRNPVAFTFGNQNINCKVLSPYVMKVLFSFRDRRIQTGYFKFPERLTKPESKNVSIIRVLKIFYGTIA